MLNWFKKKQNSPPNASPVSIAPAATAEPEPSPPQKGWLVRLRERLGHTRGLLVGKILSAIGLHAKVDEELLEEIEAILLQADVGSKATTKITDRIREAARNEPQVSPEKILDLVKTAIREILSSANRPMQFEVPPPAVFLIVGVNGTGKTTTIGKLALEISNAGRRVLVVAADTFRAAAVEQLAIWAERAGAGLVRCPEGTDPASVCHEALEGALKDPPDVILIDTAGRLHTKTNLMNELSKIIRVIKKLHPDAPHETILILDATTGQNAMNQVATFKEVAQLTGLIMTKLDGTAKGGILVAVKEAFGLPIFKIGIGEGAEDLRDFDPDDFVEALFAQEGTPS